MSILTRSELRKIIGKTIKESYQVVGPSVEELYSGPYRSLSDFKYVMPDTIKRHQEMTGLSPEAYCDKVFEVTDQSLGHVKKCCEALGCDIKKYEDIINGVSPESSGSGMYQLFGQPTGSDGRPAAPLPSHDLFALIQASADPASGYDLSHDRLSTVNSGNLTAQEQELLSRYGTEQAYSRRV